MLLCFILLSGHFQGTIRIKGTHAGGVASAQRRGRAPTLLEGWERDILLLHSFWFWTGHWRRRKRRHGSAKQYLESTVFII